MNHMAHFTLLIDDNTVHETRRYILGVFGQVAERLIDILTAVESDGLAGYLQATLVVAEQSTPRWHEVGSARSSQLAACVKCECSLVMDLSHDVCSCLS